MNKQYEHIFFDLDHTLWDFEKSSQETLRELFDHFSLAEKSEFLSFEAFRNTFFEINRHLWSLYNHNQIGHDELRYSRFPKTLLQFQVELPEKTNREMVDYYLTNTSIKPYLMENCIEILEYLQSRYPLHIITNGFEDVQHLKLSSAKLNHYFGLVVTSASAGVKKPDKEIFHYTIRNLKTNPEHCIMIGDNLETDILGAKNAGIDQIFYNPEQQKHKEVVTHEIVDLIEIKAIL